MPVDENERRTKVLKKFAREINTKYTDKYTSDEDPRSIQKYYQARTMLKPRDVPAARTEIRSIDATDFNCEFSKKVSYFEYGPTGVSKKDLVSKSKSYNSTNSTTKLEPTKNMMEPTKKIDLNKNPEYSNSKTYTSMNISTKAEPRVKNCENGDCGSHFEAKRKKVNKGFFCPSVKAHSNFIFIVCKL